MTGIKKINLISAVLVSLSLCGGCTLEKAGNSSQDQTVQEDNKTEQVKAEKAEKEEINEIHLRDKDSLYENDDDTSVVTMYLTVSKGNSSENTYHTWKEINSYSVYDYEDMGVERYQVAGLLQVEMRMDRQKGKSDMENACLMQLFRSGARHPARMHKKIIKLS